MPNYNLPARSQHFNAKLCRQTHDDLHSAGTAQRTVHGKLRSVRQLDDYCKSSRDKITEKKDWVVNIEPVGNGEAVLKCLARYVCRIAISDNRIKQVDKDGVTYRVKPSGKSHWVTRHADGLESLSEHCARGRLISSASSRRNEKRTCIEAVG